MESYKERMALTVQEAALVLRLGQGSVYAAIHRGELPARRVGKRWIIPRASLERFLDGQPAAPTVKDAKAIT